MENVFTCEVCGKDCISDKGYCRECDHTTPGQITHEAGNKEAWLCVCGNTPTADGFFPCNSEGEEVEPVASEWTTNCYVCSRCGRIIDQATLEVRGRRFPDDLYLPLHPIHYGETKEE